LKSLASTIQAVGYSMMRGKHQTVVADVLRTLEVIMMLISTVLTMKEL
jgi:hypothetical protein